MATKIVIENDSAVVNQLGSLYPGQVFSFLGSHLLYVMMRSCRICCINTGDLTTVSDYGSDRVDIVLFHTLKGIR